MDIVALDPVERGKSGCLCCGSVDMDTEYAAVSPYLAWKAWGGDPEPCRLHTCRACDFRFYDRGLTDAQGAAYYSGYRDEHYYEDRHKREPFYTRAVHASISDRLSSSERRERLAAMLADARIAPKFDCVVDYGGGDGSLILDLDAPSRISFDLSGTPGLPGIEVVTSVDALPAHADFVTCAQVLEHVSDPRGLLDDMIRLLRPGGLVYLEVPDQIWRRATGLKLGRSAFAWLCRHPRALLAADIYGTAFRVKTGILPPFGFVPMREHINFFSAQALRDFAIDAGLHITIEGRTADRSFCLIAQKPQRMN